nr:hypothetical protein [Tanacetum cinerariifolium]
RECLNSGRSHRYRSGCPSPLARFCRRAALLRDFHWPQHTGQFPRQFGPPEARAWAGNRLGGLRMAAKGLLAASSTNHGIPHRPANSNESLPLKRAYAPKASRILMQDQAPDGQ